VATKKERQRQLARERHARRQQRRAERERRAKQLSVLTIVAILVVGVGIGSAALAGAFKTTPKHPAAGPKPSATPTSTPTPSASPALVNGKCVYTKSGTAARKVNLPSAKPDTAATYQATIATNRGDIVIDLNNSAAPCTVNSFVSLADQKFFNNTQCHRLSTVDPYVLQCGDPTGTGTGGPGYAFANEVASSSATTVTYTPGTVAMANSGGNATNGSQFFLVFKNSLLQPDYTPFGTIVSGLNIIQNVAKAGSDNSSGQGDGHPKEKVEIDSVTIKKT
jgi:peptidyl-prolyl cis-trans isomerase B (cyclophilin B)